MAHVSASVLILFLFASPLPSQDRTERPPCPVAEDDKYGYTREQPVQVGGSPMYGAARQRRYLDALRGPEGQPVQYKRRGQDRGPDGTILDAYEVTYEGLASPITLFLDWYHYNPPKAPRGFTCGRPIGLGPPPVDPFQEGDALQRVAIEQGAARDFEPIPLGPAAGAAPRGAIYDRFRILAHASRQAAANGAKLDPRNLPRELTERGMVIVAYPLVCGDQSISPVAIDIVAANGAVMPKERHTMASGDEIGRLVPGIRPPQGSFAVSAPLTAPRPNDTIRITFAQGCGGASDQLNLLPGHSPARPLEMPQPELPEGAPADQPVLLQVLIDLDGQLQAPIHIGGPAALAPAAMDAITRWRVEPARINGAPVPTGTLVQVSFKAR